MWHHDLTLSPQQGHTVLTNQLFRPMWKDDKEPQWVPFGVLLGRSSKSIRHKASVNLIEKDTNKQALYAYGYEIGKPFCCITEQLPLERMKAQPIIWFPALPTTLTGCPQKGSTLLSTGHTAPIRNYSKIKLVVVLTSNVSPPVGEDWLHSCRNAEVTVLIVFVNEQILGTKAVKPNIRPQKSSYRYSNPKNACYKCIQTFDCYHIKTQQQSRSRKRHSIWFHQKTKKRTMREL